jgi:DNA replication and repair protein RecF
VGQDRLQLSQLSTQGFRNLSSDPVCFRTGVTLITGENAQGKTNLLEAVALVCGQRSFRGASLPAMASDGERFRIAATVERAAGSERVSLAWSREEGRSFFRNEKAASFREISGLCPAVLLSPEHRELLDGSPSVRRRFVDRLVLGWRPAAGDDQARYALALRERNALLLRLRLGHSHNHHIVEGELEAWTEELCVAGAALRRHRRQALAIWQGEFARLASQAGPEYAAIETRYACASAASGDSEIAGGADETELLRRACERVRSLERRRGYSMAGPHRDDLLWTRRGRPLSTQASAGEALRTVALAKLAEWSAVAKAGGVPPLFAADDFDAGLSEAWVEEFWDALPKEATVLLTTTSSPSRWARRAEEILEVSRGTVTARSLRPLRALPRAVEA